MKVAVATDDGVNISQHFGRSAGFVVFDVADSKVEKAEFRTNRHSPHAQGLCDHGQFGHGHAQGEHGAHGHAGLVGLLEGCEVVLCGGMGSGAAQALAANGVRPVIVPTPVSAQQAVEQYISGQLQGGGAGFCGCQ